MSRPRHSPKPAAAPGESQPVVGLRIIGGKFRGRLLEYSGDPRTRPMKDRVRESVFNLLGYLCKEKHALDLFAGTGALGLEALSRGASRATLLERHYPTAKIIEGNIAKLGASDAAQACFADAFLWTKNFCASANSGDSPPWLVFCSPPFEFYVSRREEMLSMISRLAEAAPVGSAFVVEADENFDMTLLPHPTAWDVRTYPPAVLGIWEKK